MSRTDFAWGAIADRTADSSVILHAPHGGSWIPEAARGEFLIDDADLARETLALTDHATDQIADTVRQHAAVSAVVDRVSRFVMDPERFDGPDEEMNAVGMGVLYTHGTRRQLIREIPDARRAEYMGRYREYSDAFTSLVDAALRMHGRAVIIDVHSYPQDPLPYELHADEPRPELCVGYDERHLSRALREKVCRAFAGYEQGDNQTFHGSYVPLKHFGSDHRVESVMLEIRRDLYLNEGTRVVVPENLQRLADALTTLVRTI